MGTIEAPGLEDLHQFTMFQRITEKEKRERERKRELKESESDFDLPEGYRMLNLETLLLTLQSTLPRASMIIFHYFTF